MSSRDNPEKPTIVNPPINPHWCLLDHPEVYNDSTLVKKEVRDAILKSQRLMNLSNSPKNCITQLPPTSAITPYFTCSICNEIPFPRKGHYKKLHNTDPIQKAVYLCKKGHPVCRECVQDFKTCMYETQLDSDSDSTDTEELDIEPSMTNFDRVTFCNAPIVTHDFIQTDLIEDTEFSCRYYYEGCMFVGRGRVLHDHEKGHVKDKREHGRGDCDQGNQGCDDDDATILSYNHSEAVAKARAIFEKIVNGPNRSMTSVPPSVLEGLKKNGSSGGRNRRH